MKLRLRLLRIRLSILHHLNFFKRHFSSYCCHRFASNFSISPLPNFLGGAGVVDVVGVGAGVGVVAFVGLNDKGMGPNLLSSCFFRIWLSVFSTRPGIGL